MTEDEVESVAEAAYGEDSGRTDWREETEWMDEAIRTHWRGVARAAIAALDKHREGKMVEDIMLFGGTFSMGGKRVDPRDVYLSRKPASPIQDDQEK